MKKSQNLLFLFGLSLLTIACNKEGEDTSLTESYIVGTWKMTEFYTKDGKTTINGAPEPITFSVTGKNFDTSLSFTENPKEVTINGSFTISATISYLGRTKTTNDDIINSPHEGTSWYLRDNILSIDADELDIISFSNNTLILAYRYIPYFDLLDDLLDFDESEITGRLYMTLEKQ